MKWTDGSEDIAEVVYNGRNTNIFNDLALLKLPLKKGNPLKLELNKISVGRDVVAIGSPKGLGFTITRGIISAIRNQQKYFQLTPKIWSIVKEIKARYKKAEKSQEERI